MIWYEYGRRALVRHALHRQSTTTPARLKDRRRPFVGSFAEREPNISSQLGVAERSALSEASAASLRKENFPNNASIY